MLDDVAKGCFVELDGWRRDRESGRSGRTQQSTGEEGRDPRQVCGADESSETVRGSSGVA